MIYTHLAVALLAVALGFGGAWKVQGWRWAAADAARAEMQREVERGRALKANVAAERHEVAREAIRSQFQTIYRDVDHVVEKPVYRHVCFDDDGLRELARAVGADRAAAREPTAAVPGAGDAR